MLGRRRDEQQQQIKRKSPRLEQKSKYILRLILLLVVDYCRVATELRLRTFFGKTLAPAPSICKRASSGSGSVKVFCLSEILRFFCQFCHTSSIFALLTQKPFLIQKLANYKHFLHFGANWIHLAPFIFGKIGGAPAPSL